MLALYNALVKINVPHDDAREVVCALERDASSLLATKSDIEGLRAATKADIEALKVATKTDIEGLRAATKADIEALKVATKTDIEGLRVDIAALKADLEGLKAATRADVEALRRDMVAVRELFDERLRSLESRMTVKVGTIMTGGIGLIATLLVVLRH